MKNLRTVIFATLLSFVFWGCVSGSEVIKPGSKNPGSQEEESTLSTEEFLKELPEGVKFKDLPQNLSDKTLKLIRRSIAEAYGEDYIKSSCLGRKRESECTVEQAQNVEKIKLVIDDNARLNALIGDMIPVDVVQYCQMAKITNNMWLAEAELLKKINHAGATMNTELSQLRDEFINRNTLKVMRDLRIDGSRYLEVVMSPFVIKLFEAAGIKD
jgi:hypothetical protein